MPKMKLFLILLIGTVGLSCSSNNQNDEIESSPKSTTDSVMIMISSGQLSKGMETIHKNCKFNIVLNTEKDTVYLETSDSCFITPEGYKIGMDWSEISKENQSKLETMTGWGHYIKLNSDWNVAFCEGTTCTDKKPSQNSKIKWIFKRNL